jgi:undecaprenyl-diphosphatase
MDLLTAMILGVIQGIAEWLPISSSGHFIIVQHFIGETPFSFNIGLHFATMLVLLVFFRHEIYVILKDLCSIVVDIWHGTKIMHAIRKTDGRRYAVLLLLTAIPTGIIGLIVALYIIDWYMQTLLPVGIAFIIQGILNLSTKFGRETREAKNLNKTDALLIGIMQGLSSFSGLSRSGSTIAISVARGVKRSDGARFSFLASIPAFIGAFILEMRDISGLSGSIEITTMLVGAITAFIVGLLSLRVLMKILKGTKFYLFSIYSFTVAGVVLALFALGL